MNEDSSAISDVAKTTHKALEIAEKAGPFLERVFGPLVENAVGIANDRLQFFRLERFYKLEDKTEGLIRERELENTRPVSPGSPYR